MKTRNKNTRRTLVQRVREFYQSLNARRFVDCYSMIDPRILTRSGAVTLDAYVHSMEAFIKGAGEVSETSFTVEGLHEGEPNLLYEGRDFAYGKTHWQDTNGRKHLFNERWVKEDNVWYTCSVGLLWPQPNTIISEGIELTYTPAKELLPKKALLPGSAKPGTTRVQERKKRRS